MESNLKWINGATKKWNCNHVSKCPVLVDGPDGLYDWNTDFDEPARLYIVAFKDKVDFEWPEPIPLLFTMSDVLKAECEKEIGYTIRKGGKGGNINDRHNWQSYKVYSVNGIQIRKLTVDEMKMMMGFPESFIFPVSKTQAMKQIGNSVAVDVIKAIYKNIIKLPFR